MKKSDFSGLIKLICFLLLMAKFSISIGQVDTSDVFVIGDKAPVELAEDTLIVKRRDITNCFKMDAGRIYSEVFILSYEHLIDNDRWSLEYELGYDIETDKFWYDWYTDYKFVELENNAITYDAGFRSSYSFVLSVGVALKHYLSKTKSGIYGWYFGIKLKERYGWVSVKNDSNFGAYPAMEFNGGMNFIEVSPIWGYSMCFWDFLIVDPFLGPSAILASTRYASFEEDDYGYYWQKKNIHKVFPAVHFGLRIGIETRGISRLIF